MKQIILDKHITNIGAAVALNGAEIKKPVYTGKRDDVQRFTLQELVYVKKPNTAKIVWFVSEGGQWYIIPDTTENSSPMADFMGHFCSRVTVSIEA